MMKTWIRGLVAMGAVVAVAGCAMESSEIPSDGVDPEQTVDQSAEDLTLTARTPLQSELDKYISTFGKDGTACETKLGRTRCATTSSEKPVTMRVGDNFQPDMPLYVCAAKADGTGLYSCSDPAPVRDCGSGICGCSGFLACIDMLVFDCDLSTVECVWVGGEPHCMCLEK